MTEELAVFLDRKHLGTLSLDGLADHFALLYDQSWLRDEGYAISPHLKPEHCRSESIKRFLANLLPEGKWLDELSLDQQISKSNIFGLIAAIGVETTGALTFKAQSAALLPTATSFRLVTPEELRDRLSQRQQISIASWDGKPRLSVAGVQDKLPVLIGRDGQMGFGEGELASTHILKFGTRPEMHLVINEHVCMNLARMVKLPVAAVSIARYGEPVLVIERFDRRWSAERVRRLHLIDGCQLLDLPPTYKYERPFGKTGEGARIRIGATLPALYEACHQCRIPALARRDLLNWSLFQLLIGNNDAHGKNISFLVTRQGIDVAPAYDLINIEIYGDEYDRDLAIAIGDTFALAEIHAYQLAEMCDECGLPQRQVAHSLKTLCSSLLKAMENFNCRHYFVDDEVDFAESVLMDIKIRCTRFKELAEELPLIEL